VREPECHPEFIPGILENAGGDPGGNEFGNVNDNRDPRATRNAKIDQALTPKISVFAFYTGTVQVPSPW
jgi:hypothetical protein